MLQNSFIVDNITAFAIRNWFLPFHITRLCFLPLKVFADEKSDDKGDDKEEEYSNDYTDEGTRCYISIRFALPGSTRKV